jgi:hypothetical protein
MKVVCCKCGVVIKEGSDKHISHGLCLACFKHFLKTECEMTDKEIRAEIKALKE